MGTLRDNLSLDFFVVDPMLHVTLSFPAKPRTEYHGSNLLSCRATLTVMENPTMEVWGGGGRPKVSSVIYAVILS